MPTPAATSSSTAVTPTTSSKYQAAKNNLSYLIDPSKPTAAPTRFRTRALLRTARYIAIFIFWRLYRYAKYAAVGAISAAVAGTAVGTLTGGLGFLLAPTGVLGGAGMGLLWGMGRVGWAGWRMLARRVRSGQAGEKGVSARVDERRVRAERLEERGVREDPW